MSPWRSPRKLAAGLSPAEIRAVYGLVNDPSLLARAQLKLEKQETPESEYCMAAMTL